MKIYARTDNSDPYDLTRYVGKPVWVSVNCRPMFLMHGFAKFDELCPEDKVKMTFIRDDYLEPEVYAENLYELWIREDKKAIPSEHLISGIFPMKIWERSEPIEMYSDAEVQQMIEENEKLFKERYGNDTLQ